MFKSVEDERKYKNQTLVIVTQSLKYEPNNGELFEGGRGVLRFELDRGVPLEPQNPYPSLRVILAKMGTQF